MKKRTAIKTDLFADERHRKKIDALGDPLAEVESCVDFGALAAEVDRVAPRAVSPQGGRPPYPTETMVRILVLKRLYNLSDEQMEYQLLDRMSYKRFCGLANATSIPDRTTVWTFENRIGKAGAKVSFDGNADFRHAERAELRDLSEEDEKEIEASKYDLAYVALDGNIGCMVNGAGLAMATMDIIKLYGAEPANFLDVGGGASKEKVTAAFKIITADPAVKGILVNIFGGIMKCDVIAEGVIAAVKEVGLKVPLVVRLEGTNVELGKKIIDESGLNVISADDLDDAAQKIVKAVKGTA